MSDPCALIVESTDGTNSVFKMWKRNSNVTGVCPPKIFLSPSTNSITDTKMTKAQLYSIYARKSRK